MSDLEFQAFASFFMSYLRRYGIDKSAADDLAMAALKANRFAVSSVNADPSYNPEYWDAMGESAADQDIGAQVNPSLEAMINPDS